MGVICTMIACGTCPKKPSLGHSALVRCILDFEKPLTAFKGSNISGFKEDIG